MQGKTGGKNNQKFNHSSRREFEWYGQQWKEKEACQRYCTKKIGQLIELDYDVKKETAIKNDPETSVYGKMVVPPTEKEVINLWRIC